MKSTLNKKNRGNNHAIQSSKGDCFIYTRVSTDRQAEEGYSLREQEKTCRDMAERIGYVVKKVFVEDGASGTSLNRPKFQEMLSLCSEDRDVKAVFVIHTDRFARNTLEHLTVKALLRRYAVRLVSVHQPMLDDSPEGNLMDIVLAGVNEFYSKDLGRKVSKALIQKAEEGWWPGQAPPGYLNTEDSKTGDKIIIADPERFDLIRDSFSKFASGRYTVAELIEKHYKKGLKTRAGKKYANSTMTHVLKNIFYTGKIYFSGKVYEGKHPPAVNLATYNKVQLVLESHNAGANRKRKHDFLLSGLLFCKECGKQMTGEVHTKPSGLVFKYYRCNGTNSNSNHKCHQPYVPCKDIEGEIAKWLKDISLSETYLVHLKNALEIILREQNESGKNESVELKNKRQAIIQKMDKLENLLLEGVMDKERAVQKYHEIKTDLKNIEARIATTKEFRPKLTPEIIKQIPAFLKNLDNMYQDFDRSKKKSFLKIIASKIMVFDKQISRINYSNTFQNIANKDLVRISENWQAIRELIRTFIGDK